MPQLRDFTISVVDPNTTIPFVEYKVSATHDTTECYIESEAERRFSISLRLSDEHLDKKSAYRLDLWMDGKKIKQIILGNLGERIHMYDVIAGADIGPTELLPFVFGNTRFTGDQVLTLIYDLCVEDGQIDTALLSKLGSITAKIYRIWVLGKSTHPKRLYLNSEETAQGPVNEKAKKALLTHSVK